MMSIVLVLVQVIFTVQPLNINVGGLTPCWTGWRPLRKERGAAWGAVVWGAAALRLIRRLIFRWSSKSVSAYCAMLCSLLCPVIAVILSFDTPPFCNLRTSVFRTLWFVNLLPLLSRPAFFAIVFMNSLILLSTTGCSEYHSAGWGFFRGLKYSGPRAEFCWTLTHLEFQQFHATSVISWRKYSLRYTPVLLHQSSLPCFCQPFRPLHVLYLISTWLPHKFKSSRFIWRCSWTPLVPNCWLRVYHSEWFRLSALLRPNAPLSHSSSSSSAVRGSALFFHLPLPLSRGCMELHFL